MARNLNLLATQTEEPLTPEQVRAYLELVRSDIQSALHLPNLHKEDRWAYTGILKQISFIDKLEKLKENGELITHQEAKDIYATGIQNMTFGFEYAALFCGLSEETDEEELERLLPFSREKPSFDSVLTQIKGFTQNINAYHDALEIAEKSGQFYSPEEIGRKYGFERTFKI